MKTQKYEAYKTISYGGIAQLGEHLPCKQGVMSSNLIISTSERNLTDCTLKIIYWEQLIYVLILSKQN